MSNFSTAGSSLKAGSVVLLKDVEIPERFFNRVKTMSPILDSIIGGDDMPGVMPGSSIVFTGFPGSGKSTTMLQLMEFWAQSGISCLYNVGEENEYAVKYRAQKLGLQGLFPVSKFPTVESLIKYVIDNKVEIVVQDSLQSMDGEDLEGQKLLKHNVTKLTALSKEHGTTVWMVGHITKGGSLAGPQKIVHDVDIHCHLSMNKDTGGRIFQLVKNRFGPSGVPYEFMMAADGMQFKEVSNEPEQTKASQRKQDGLKLVKDLLVSGVRLSGYSHDEVKEIREKGWNGGFMRAMLSLACAELESEGLIIGSETINRRQTFFVEV